MAAHSYADADPARPAGRSNLNNNKFTGMFPEIWGIGPAFLQLADLQIANNQLTGTFPESFALTNTSFVSLMSM